MRGGLVIAGVSPGRADGADEGLPKDGEVLVARIPGVDNPQEFHN